MPYIIETDIKQQQQCQQQKNKQPNSKFRVENITTFLIYPFICKLHKQMLPVDLIINYEQICQ